jgi:psiF repeat
MKFLITTLFLFAFSFAHAEDTCNARATEKKLAGAAKTSFLKKCEKDARAACEMDDISKKTSGAAKEAHIKKCVKDSVGG